MSRVEEELKVRVVVTEVSRRRVLVPSEPPVVMPAEKGPGLAKCPPSNIVPFVRKAVR